MTSPHETLYQRAQEQYVIGNHLLDVTYPLVHDPKLFLGIVNNIVNSLNACVSAILSYEKYHNLIASYNLSAQNNLNEKLSLLQTRSPSRNKIPQKTLQLLRDLHAILELHKKSPIEFSRAGKMVICSKEFDLKTISLNQIEEYLYGTKELLEITNKILTTPRTTIS